MTEARPLRVLQVVHGLGRGGLENGVINLLNGLPPEAIEQAVCCLDRRGEMADRIARPLPLWVLERGRHDWRAPLRLARLLRDWQPDLIHCRNWNTWPDAVLAHRLAGRPGRLIWSFHGFADGYWFPRRRRLASRLLAAATDRLAAVCEDSATRYGGLAGIPASRFRVLYNGVDCARFAPVVDRAAERARLGLPADALIVVTVASLTPVKGHADLLAALARLPRGGRRALRFLWIGEGAERAALTAQRDALGLTDLVDLAGASDQVPALLGCADLFVLPSRLEGMSNAILEAMAAGLPVIANRVGGNPELVLESETGLLCRPDDPADLAGALARLINDDALREGMGRAARARAERVFSLPAMLARYADFYREVAR